MKNLSQKIKHGNTHESIEKNNKKLNAMLQCKCPVCKEGDMFKTSALNMGQFNELNKNCEKCGFGFMPEPGFYQISMFFTYMVGVAIFMVFGFLAYLVFSDPPLWVYYVSIFIPTLITTPWNLRYSKVIMLYYFGDIGEN